MRQEKERCLGVKETEEGSKTTGTGRQTAEGEWDEGAGGWLLSSVHVTFPCTDSMTERKIRIITPHCYTQNTVYHQPLYQIAHPELSSLSC